jgi:hypothetical protein
MRERKAHALRAFWIHRISDSQISVPNVRDITAGKGLARDLVVGGYQ